MFNLPTYYMLLQIYRACGSTVICLTSPHVILLQIYRACGSTVICYPLLFETSDFYLCQDMRLVLDDVKVVHAPASYCGILLVHALSASSNTCQMHYFSSSACTNTPTWLLARDVFVAAMEASVRVSKVQFKASQLKCMTVFSLHAQFRTRPYFPSSSKCFT